MLFGKSKKYEDPMKNKYAHLYVEHEPVFQTEEETKIQSELEQPNLGATDTELDFNIQSPWRGIWLKPKETVQLILKGNYGMQAMAIAMLAGVTYGFNHAQSQHLAESFGLLNILAMSILTGVLGGLVGLFLGSYLLFVVGKRLGGKSSFQDMWKVMGWASMPSAAAAVLWLVAILIFGDEFFRLQMISLQEHYLLFGVYMLIVLAMFFLRLWHLMTLFACLAQVQQFSVKRAVLNVFLTIVVVMVPIVFLMIWI